MKKRLTGFTLTELMTVVIIVAILAGIGFGSYKKAVERSHFTEGQVAGSNVLESVNRYYYDNPDLDEISRSRPKVEYLDIDLSNSGICTQFGEKDYCLRTKYFEVVIYDGRVQVNRVQNDTLKDYYFVFYPDYYSEHHEEECNSRTEVGYDLCKTMGYIYCSGSGQQYICKKQ